MNLETSSQDLQVVSTSVDTQRKTVDILRSFVERVTRFVTLPVLVPPILTGSKWSTLEMKQELTREAPDAQICIMSSGYTPPRAETPPLQIKED